MLLGEGQLEAGLPQGLQSRGAPPPDPQPRLETYRDDVPLQAMGRVCAFDHGTQLGVAHPRLGAGGAHGTWVEERDGSCMSRMGHKMSPHHCHMAEERREGGTAQQLDRGG